MDQTHSASKTSVQQAGRKEREKDKKKTKAKIPIEIEIETVCTAVFVHDCVYFCGQSVSGAECTKTKTERKKNSNILKSTSSDCSAVLNLFILSRR